MQKMRGFSLIEALTAAAVAATLAAVAVPSLAGVATRQRLALTVNELLLAIDLGRSESLASGTRVALAPKSGGDWSSGWLLYRDLNDNGVREAGEPVLRQFERPDARVRFSAHGAIASATMSFEEAGLIRRAGSNGLMLGRLNVTLDGQIRTVCFGAARVRVVAGSLTCS